METFEHWIQQYYGFHFLCAIESSEKEVELHRTLYFTEVLKFFQIHFRII